MDPRQTLAQVFHSNVDESARTRFAGSDELDAALDELVTSARAAWPRFELPEDFVAYLAQRLPDYIGGAAALGQIRAADLYLAFACARGLPAAMSTVEREHLPVLERHLVKNRIHPEVVQDSLQTFRTWLFLPHAGQLPRISRFHGRGDLRKWLLLVGARMAYKAMAARQRDPHQLASASVLDELPNPEGSPELRYFRLLYRDSYRQGVTRALAALPPRQQQVLRMHAIEGLSIDQIGAIFEVHRATAARWLNRARQALMQQTRETLMAALDVDPSGIESILQLIHSDMGSVLASVLEDS